MTRAFRSILILALVGAGILGGWRYLHCMDRVYAYYPSHAAVVAASAAERSWIPETVPDEAFDIHTEHDLDTNGIWVRFSLPADRIPFLSDAMGMGPVADVHSVPVRKPCSRGWWFTSLIEQHPANDAGLDAWLYEVPGNSSSKAAYVAVDRFTPTVYYWSAP